LSTLTMDSDAKTEQGLESPHHKTFEMDKKSLSVEVPGSVDICS